MGCERGSRGAVGGIIAGIVGAASSRRRRCGVIVGVSSMLLLGLVLAPTALASSLSITTSTSSAPAGQSISFTAAGSSDHAYWYVEVYADHSGAGCAPTSWQEYNQTGGSPLTFTPVYQTGPYSVSGSVSEYQVGTYLLCGYLSQNGSCFGSSACGPTDATGSATITFVTPPPPPGPPACGDTSADLTFSVPPRLLGGRTGSIAIRTFDDGFDERNLNLTIAAASSQPIRYPASMPITLTGSGDWFGSLRTASGDGPITATLTWTQTQIDGSMCSATDTARVQVLSVGDQTRAALDWQHERSVSNNDFTGAPSGEDQQVDLRFFGSCETLRPRSAFVVITGAGRTVRIRLRDVCGRWATHRHLNLPYLNVSASDARFPTPALLTLEAIGRRTTTHVYHLRVSYGSRTYRTTVTASVDYRPNTRVYQGTDAFVNYCIDQHKVIRSSNGRLYCDRPGYRNTYLS